VTHVWAVPVVWCVIPTLTVVYLSVCEALYICDQQGTTEKSNFCQSVWHHRYEHLDLCIKTDIRELVNCARLNQHLMHLLYVSHYITLHYITFC